ncbi:hypothetical protein BJ980_001976 [Nocardioides daedukensis]|uniref:Endonuclease/exonuclease/phosphatase domain-containing protein n=1 Tax=Nocardioides daedukensis TaxID=634462 RepID=A0A7Y9UNZ1_9ACTN|nr:hypothetical protein [Nocardioides daedukensis]NYG59053.1 hypothetical protein [Nocardioides daedukensis]
MLKKTAPALALLLGAALVPATTTAPATAAPPTGTAYDTIGVTSFNAFHNLTAAQARSDAHKLISAADVDIIGWQEAERFLSVYDRQLPGGWRTAKFFNARGSRTAREVPISWNNNVYALVKGSNKAYVAHGGVAGKFPARFTTRVVLKHRRSGKTITVLNAHANSDIQRHDPGHCGEARSNINARLAKVHFQEIRDIAARQRSTHTVLTGDLNVRYACDRARGPQSFPYRKFAGVLVPSYARLKNPTLGTKGTNFIDYVYLGARDVNGTAKDAMFVSHRVYGGLQSDHRPINARIKLYR